MLLPPTEAILMGAVVVLYLYDSAVLLYSNEGVMYPVGGSRWAIAFGSDRFQWRGRDVFLPNPFAPHRPLYRLHWSYGKTASREVPPVWPRGYGGLAFATWGMVAALGVLLPVGLFSRWGDVMIVAALVLFYGSALGALGLLWRRRESLGVGRGRFLHLAFESLTCPPFAVNLIRHVSLATRPSVGLVPAARALQSAVDWEETRMRLLARLHDELRWTDAASRETEVIRAELDRLESMRAAGDTLEMNGSRMMFESAMRDGKERP